ncbi:acyl-CoA thioesterase [Luteimonas qiangzhengi]|uniref:acyl-CoA thioesterase n=1 Tax=Luteimonas sp. MJ146 TaxID=3129240 RepID=UPI0031BAD758
MSNVSQDPSQAPLFQMPLSVRWRDLDAFNHVNNSNFLTYLEEARIRWFESLDEEWVTEATAPLLAAVQINYRMPIPYPSEPLVQLYCERLGNSSVTISHRIVSPDGATLYADGHVVMVWVERASGRPTPLPDAVRRAAAGPGPAHNEASA